MRHGSRPFRRVYALTLTGGAALLASAAPPAATTSVEVTVTDLRNDKGVVRACLTTVAKGWPNSCKAYEKVIPSGSKLQFTFTDIPPGRYAIALLHDENNNGKADLALGMMPKEGFGFSRDAKVRMGPPKFTSAAFDVSSQKVSQTIRMRYMF
ncbi:MAG: DUF2141 domain-containing protein [Sphingomonadaceae bacterium]